MIKNTAFNEFLYYTSIFMFNIHLTMKYITLIFMIKKHHFKLFFIVISFLIACKSEKKEHHNFHHASEGADQPDSGKADDQCARCQRVQSRGRRFVRRLPEHHENHLWRCAV